MRNIQPFGRARGVLPGTGAECDHAAAGVRAERGHMDLLPESCTNDADS